MTEDSHNAEQASAVDESAGRIFRGSPSLRLASLRHSSPLTPAPQKCLAGKRVI